MPGTVGEWFCLANKRMSFAISPFEDPDLYFGRVQLLKELTDTLEQNFAMGYSQRLLLYGEFGVGKTHTLKHIQYFLEHSGQKVVCKYLVMGDVERKTRFVSLHRNIMDAVGRDEVTRLLRLFQAKHGASIKDELKKRLTSESLVNAFGSLLSFGTQVDDAWAWLQWLPVGDSSSRLGVSGDLTSSTELVRVLKFVSELYWVYDGKWLIILVDEAERLANAKDPDAVNNWKEALTLVADAKERSKLGIIFAVAGIEEKKFPPPLTDGQVIRRFDEKKSYKQLKSFPRPETELFVKDLLGNLVDKKCLAAEIKKEKLDKKAGFKQELYPFTEDGYTAFIKALSANREVVTPSYVIEMMGRVGFAAFKKPSPVIDKQIVDGVDFR